MEAQSNRGQQRVESGDRRAAEAHARGKDCVRQHLEYCAARKRILEYLKLRGSYGKYMDMREASLLRLEEGNEKLRLLFKLGEAFSFLL
jgi:hypothetical protein